MRFSGCTLFLALVLCLICIDSGAPGFAEESKAVKTKATSSSAVTVTTAGASAKVTNGAPAKASNGAPAKASNGAPAKATTGAPAKVTNGAPAKATTGAPAKVTNGAPAKVTNGAGSAKAKTAPSKHSARSQNHAAKHVPKNAAKTAAKKTASPALSQEPVWHDVAAGFAMAKKEKKLIITDFYTDWCGWCKIMEVKTFTDPSVQKMFKDFVLVKANAEDNGDGQKLASMLGIQGFPSTVVFDSEGTPKGIIIGFRDPDSFKAGIKEILTGKPHSADPKSDPDSKPTDAPSPTPNVPAAPGIPVTPTTPSTTPSTTPLTTPAKP